MKKDKFKELFKTSDIAKITSTSIATVISEIKKGRLKAIKVGSEYRITEQALNDYLGLTANNYKTSREIELEMENEKLRKTLSSYETTVITIKNELLRL